MSRYNFDYSALKGKITSLFGTLTNFSKAMKVSIQTISKKMNNLVPWDQDEIYLACQLLGIQNDIKNYFFTTKVEKK